MRTLRARFILSHLIPLLVIVPLAGLVLFYLLQTEVMLSDLSGELNQQASLIAAAADGRSDIFNDSQEAQTFVTNVSTLVGGHILLFHPSGQLMASSDPDAAAEIPAPVENLPSVDEPVAIFYSLTQRSATVSVPILDLNDEVVGIVQVTNELRNVSDRFGLLRYYILLVLVGQLVVGGVVGLVLALRLERPIHNITSAVENITIGQPVDRVPESGPQEIRQLGRTVNALAERLHTLEEARRRLLANLVHELGRPLGALRSAVHVLRHGVGEDAEVRQELLSGMETEIERMLPLLDDLTRIHGQILGTLELNLRVVNLAEWLPPLLLPWQAAAEENGLNWQANLPADLPALRIDPDRLAQAIGNLISNAIKYTPAGGTVLVTAVATLNEFTLKISDTGPGIEQEEQARIFEPFYRSQQQRRFPKGLGLGLTIAHDWVVAHNGRLTLDSVPGQGSHFTIHLPVIVAWGGELGII
ncbi:MAG: HAMP domain-containing histidine kinase [Ardenticatenaceae bacterium]|nr:HAMP domain-containing histidine kinase [Ardenticatenaceae bacterium]